MRRNIAITPEIIRAQSGEAAQLLTKLNKLDRNSKQARKIRRQLRELGVRLSGTQTKSGFLGRKRGEGRKSWKEKVIERMEKERTWPSKKRAERKRRKLEGERLDQVLDTAQQLVLAGYKTPSQIGKRLMEIYPQIDLSRAGKAALQALIKKNPRYSYKTKRYKKLILTKVELQRAKYRFKSMLPGHSKYRELKRRIKELREQYHKLGGTRRYNPLKKSSGGWREKYWDRERKYYELEIHSGDHGKIIADRKKYSSFLESKKAALNYLRGGAHQVNIMRMEYNKLRRKFDWVGENIYLQRDIPRILGKLKKNPPSGAKEIYGRIMAIEAQKGPKSNYPNEYFRHDFKKGSKIFGLSDGSILIKGKKKLWKEFEA